MSFHSRYRGDRALSLWAVPPVDEEFDAIDETFCESLEARKSADGRDLFGASHFRREGSASFKELLCGLAPSGSRIGVSIVPGLRMLTRILRSLSSTSCKYERRTGPRPCWRCRRRSRGIRLDAGDGSVQEDGTIVVEQWQRLLHSEERAAHVQVKGLVEVFFGYLFELGQTRPVLGRWRKGYRSFPSRA